jgi:hypothetical protein|tara:strand:+ start:942 stop:2207 length:1266 start_codon:yes stop_codon:yes gene_type:complete
MPGIIKVDEIEQGPGGAGVKLKHALKDSSGQDIISETANTVTVATDKLNIGTTEVIDSSRQIKNTTLADSVVPAHSYMFRNKIINGSMSVAQYSTTPVTGVTASGKPVVCDRWHTFGSGFGEYTLAQSTDAPAGFATSLLIDNTATSGAGGSDHFGIQYKFEGQELQSFVKGNSAAQPMTVSWYSKTTKPGVYTVELDDRDNTRSISAQFTATTAWTRHSVTFPGDTTGALDNDNLASLHLSWWLMAGTGFTSGTLQTAWDARTNANRVSSTNINLSDNIANSFYITGVQLEMGNTATPFEHRQIGMELSLCQRYFFNFTSLSGLIIHPYTSTLSQTNIYFPVSMRSTPTIATITSDRVALGGVSNISTTLTSGTTSYRSNSGGSQQVTIRFTSSTSLTTGTSYMIFPDSVNSGATFSSEL